MRVSWLKTVVLSPSLYAVWAAFVVLALIVSYRVDPYAFGFSTIILGWMSVPVVACGGVLALVAKSLPVRARILIGLSLVVAAAALVTALVLLRTFNWA